MSLSPLVFVFGPSSVGASELTESMRVDVTTPAAHLTFVRRNYWSDDAEGKQVGANCM